MSTSLAHHTPSPSVDEAPQLRRWTRREYEQMAQQGLFNHQRVELIDGVIFQMTPQKSIHATAIGLAHQALTRILPHDCHTRTQLPLTLDERSEPEPDVAVVAGSVRDYTARHPAMARLVIEISDNTLNFDRGDKARLYARAGIPEYWIINLKDRQVEVHREPGEGGYTQVTVHGAGDSVSPLVASNSPIAVKDLLP